MINPYPTVTGWFCNNNVKANGVYKLACLHK